MFQHMIVMIALGVGGSDASAQEFARAYGPRDQAADATQRREGRFWVQFRQPDWREHVFDSRQEMDDYITNQRRNGWELQVFSRELRVRDRLMQWGGSRIFDTLPEANAWAQYLERELGYQPRVVDAP